jgi:hypothetical protein
MELASCHISGAWNLEVVPGFLENWRTPDVSVLQLGDG